MLDFSVSLSELAHFFGDITGSNLNVAIQDVARECDLTPNNVREIYNMFLECWNTGDYTWNNVVRTISKELNISQRKVQTALERLYDYVKNKQKRTIRK